MQRVRLAGGSMALHEQPRPRLRLKLYSMRCGADWSRPAIIFEFLDIMRRAPVLPPPLRPAQRLLVRAAIDLTPAPMRKIIGLDAGPHLSSWEGALIRLAGAAADRVIIDTSPAVQACRRLGLPANYLYCRG